MLNNQKTLISKGSKGCQFWVIVKRFFERSFSLSSSNNIAALFKGIKNIVSNNFQLRVKLCKFSSQSSMLKMTKLVYDPD